MTSAWPLRLHLFTLSSFAVAQPLYDLLGRHPEFLVAHRAEPATIGVLVIALSVVIPLLVVLLVEATRLAGTRTSTVAHRTMLFLLVALVVAGTLNQRPAWLAVPLSVAAGALALLAYRATAAGTFLSVLTPAVLIFPLVFVTATPVRRLAFPREAARDVTGVRRTPPVVFVIFDELDTFSLLDRSGAIDRERFPNFAALADSATWFPNAVSADPFTPVALPSILSGITADGTSGKLPIAADHPQNLFTWLGGSYAMNVLEPISRLCPTDLCDDSGSTADSRELTSDLWILYLHLITPRELAERSLPPLAFAWKGFGGTRQAPAVAAPTEADLSKLVTAAVALDRAQMFRQFINSIEPGGARLHFGHLLLPHDPYEFLPSGARYPHGGLTAGLTGEGQWTTDSSLVETGRDRHVAQVRFVDSLLGELVTHLRARGMYDPSLIVIASDHGAAFRAGDHHRSLTATNYTELLAAPIFLKLPSQTAGVVDERRGSGVDILPTIADVLGTPLRWRSDGQSLLSSGFPARDLLEYRGTGVGALPAFDVRAAARDAAASASRRKSEGNELVGRPLAELDVVDAPSDVLVLSDNFRSFADVRRNSGQIPALVHGRIEDDGGRTGPLTVAIAIDGVIRAVTQTAPWYGAPNFFAALLSEDSLHDGSNRLQVLIVERGASPARLAAIGSDFTTGLQIRRDASGETLTTASGREFAIGPHIVGNVDRADRHPNGVTLHGWAVDSQTLRTLRSVAAFAGDTPIAFTTPRGHRPDVDAALSLTRSPDAAFALDLRVEDLKLGQVRLFGISTTGSAGEIALSEPIRAALRLAAREPQP